MRLESSSALIDLGRRLFVDPLLSGPRTRSCATCHDLARAFTDGRARAEPLATSASSSLRNTPTLLNAGLQPTQFFDDRARALEDQVGLVLSSPAEMGSSPELAAEHLTNHPEYRAAFAAAAGSTDSVVTSLHVRVALAAFVRSLTALDSRFDRAVRGDTTAMTADERDGFTIFMRKAHCGVCHFPPLFNGALPPHLDFAEPEIIGMPQVAGVRRPRLDPAPGARVRIISISTASPSRSRLFATSALTAPCMHNGVFQSLEEVIDFYDAGGGAGRGVDLPTQTLPADSLHLTHTERAALIASLGALTDTVPRPRRASPAATRARNWIAITRHTGCLSVAWRQTLCI